MRASGTRGERQNGRNLMLVKRVNGDASMTQVENCCFRKNQRDDLLPLIIHVSQQESLTLAIEAAMTSGGELGNGKNQRR
jgi:hypothetical protein